MYPLTEMEMLKATLKSNWNSVRLYKTCPEMKFIYDTKTEMQLHCSRDIFPRNLDCIDLL